MAGDSGGLRIPFGWAVAVIVVFLAFANVIDVRVADVSLAVGPAARGRPGPAAR